MSPSLDTAGLKIRFIIVGVLGVDKVDGGRFWRRRLIVARESFVAGGSLTSQLLAEANVVLFEEGGVLKDGTFIKTMCVATDDALRCGRISWVGADFKDRGAVNVVEFSVLIVRRDFKRVKGRSRVVIDGCVFCLVYVQLIDHGSLGWFAKRLVGFGLVVERFVVERL